MKKDACTFDLICKLAHYIQDPLSSLDLMSTASHETSVRKKNSKVPGANPYG